LFTNDHVNSKPLSPIIVLGIGNVLMGDEGVGVHCIKSLTEQAFRNEVELVDGGTGGFHLLGYFEHYALMVIIDATMDGSAPGTVKILRPKFASEFPRTLSAHDIGLRDMVETAALLKELPPIELITVSIAQIQPMRPELSEPVRGAIPEVIESVRTILDRFFHTTSVNPRPNG
jgi:hydrogenase maturation protease